MILKKENLYLFLALILIISTNIYFSCRLLENQEGFMRKVKKFFEKEIKNNLIKKPIKAIPFKPLRKYFENSINFKKSLFKVIMQLVLAIFKAGMIIAVIVPVLTIFLMPLITSLLSFIASSSVVIFQILFKKPVTIPKSFTGAQGLPPGLPPGLPRGMPWGMPRGIKQNENENANNYYLSFDDWFNNKNIK